MRSDLAAKLAALEQKFQALSAQMSDPGFVSDQTRYVAAARAYGELEPIVMRARDYRETEQELSKTRELIRTTADPELKKLAQEEAADLERRLSELEIKLTGLLVPRDPNDAKNVILEIRAGTGGNEASLFAQEIFRMYSRFAERQGWRVEVLSSSTSGLGGRKEVIASIEGKGAYSRLKYESGVHRVQRVPVTESAGRIHTSTVTVAILPEAEEVEVAIAEKDLRIDRFCSTGPGGQSVNTTYSAVRITHVPTGLVVSCQDEKSQHKNKARALRVLRSRLYNMKLQEQQAQRAKDRREQVGTGERSEKIRTYNFPQGRVTDHRINLTLHRLEDLLDGNLNPLLEPLITYHQAEKLKEEVRV
ncbi:MAG: peptide chain release factor 1 [Acidobacteriota bacterium]